MRIISKYHDYYDGAMAHGIDPSLIYKRDQELVKASEVDWNPGSVVDGIFDSYPWDRNYWMNSTDLALLLFCGKAYPYWYTQAKDQATQKDRVWVVTCEALIERAGALYKRRREFKEERGQIRTGDPFFPRLSEAEGFLSGKDEFWGPRFRAKNVEAFAKQVAGRPVDHNAHHHWKAPSLLLARRSGNGGPKQYAVLRNPVLKDLEFQKVMDPFTAFQEIAMFLGGVLAVEDQAPLRVGSDEVVARQKGFDEWSFRTMPPGQKKLNRRANRIRKRRQG